MFAQVDAADLRQVLEDMQQVFKGERAHNRSGKIAHAPQHHHHDGVRAHLKPHEFGVDIARLDAPQVARQTGQAASQREGGELVAKGGKTHRPHAVFVDTNAGQRPAKRAPEQPPQKRIDQQHRAQREVIQRALAVQVKRHPAKHRRVGLEVDVKPVRAAQHFVVKKQEKHHLGKGHGDHDEVDAVGANHKKSNHQRRQPRAQYGHRQAPPQADRLSRRGQKSQRIARQAEIGGMAQRN